MGSLLEFCRPILLPLIFLVAIDEASAVDVLLQFCVLVACNPYLILQVLITVTQVISLLSLFQFSIEKKYLDINMEFR